MHAAAKMSVSGPGIVDAVSIISLWSYMIPCVEYSGKMTKSMPGNPDCKSKSVSHVLKRDDWEELVCYYLHSNKHFADAFGIAQDLFCCVKPWHLVVYHSNSDGVIATRDVSSSRHVSDWSLKICWCFVWGFCSWKTETLKYVLTIQLHFRCSKHLKFEVTNIGIKSRSMFVERYEIGWKIRSSLINIEVSHSNATAPLCLWKFNSQMWQLRGTGMRFVPIDLTKANF